MTQADPFAIQDYRQVYEAVALPVLIIDHASWRILAVNEAALEQYGYEREEFVGLPVLEVRPPEGRADARRVMSEIPHGFWKTTGVQHARKDGSVFSADVWSRDTVVDGRAELGSERILLDMAGRLIGVQAQCRRSDRELAGGSTAAWTLAVAS